MAGRAGPERGGRPPEPVATVTTMMSFQARRAHFEQLGPTGLPRTASAGPSPPKPLPLERVALTGSAAATPPRLWPTASEVRRLAKAAAAGGVLVVVLCSVALSLLTCSLPWQQRRPTGPAARPLGFFLRAVPSSGRRAQPLHDPSQWLDGVALYRLLPGAAARPAAHHADGPPAIAMFRFENGRLITQTQQLALPDTQPSRRCLFRGLGAVQGSVLPSLCWADTSAALVPVGGQLWLTSAAAGWAQIDAYSLQPRAARDQPASPGLGGHPACTPAGECFVQHPCGAAVLSQEACMSRLRSTSAGLERTLLGRVTLPHTQLLHRGAKPCVTAHFVVAKLESFWLRRQCPAAGAQGLLRFVQEYEDRVWMVVDRRTNASRLLVSNASFTHTHLLSCTERADAIDIVVMAARSRYDDVLFAASLQGHFDWSGRLRPPLRCALPLDGALAACRPLLANSRVVLDHPRAHPRAAPPEWAYALAPRTRASRWFNMLLKVHLPSGTVARAWTAKDIFLTAADFVPRPGGPAEDDGALLTVAYNASEDRSYLYVFDPRRLELMDDYPLRQVLPFHSGGALCLRGHCVASP